MQTIPAIDTLVGSLAHEIKNPLTSVRTFVQLVCQKHHDHRFLEKFERIVLQELDRIDCIVQELLQLAKPARLQCTMVDISAIVQRVVEVYGERMQQQAIVLKTDYAPTLPLLLADAEQLYRAFANITLNAIEAMPEGGELGIACRPVPQVTVDFAAPGGVNAPAESSHSPTLTLDLYAPGIEVVFSDTGEGIPAEQLDVLFRPFHTTKPKGTGLGLALTCKIIEAHGGRIDLTSQVGHGTLVTVTLPALAPGPILHA
jgi:signal transduction histidine kinase